MDIINPSNITFALGIIAIIFSVYKSFTDPQVKSEKTDALLGQQVQWMVEGNERRFNDIQINFKELLLQSNNHIHTVDTKVEMCSENISKMSERIVELSTIINERIPKK